VCERMLVDSTWFVGWLIDRSSSVISKKSVLKIMDRTAYFISCLLAPALHVYQARVHV